MKSKRTSGKDGAFITAVRTCPNTMYNIYIEIITKYIYLVFNHFITKNQAESSMIFPEIKSSVIFRFLKKSNPKSPSTNVVGGS